MKKQAKSLLKKAKEAELPIKHVVLDCGYKYTSDFNDVFEKADIRIELTAPRAPNQNAFIERWIGSIKHECLNRFFAFGLKHLDYLIEEYVRYYNELRPHSRKDDKPLLGLWQDSHNPPDSQEQVVCHTRLGDVLKHYECIAA